MLTISINVIPDHEHIFHGDRTKETVAWSVKRYNWSDAYGNKAYSMADWTNIAIGNIEENERCGITSVILVHPLCMYLADGFKGLKKILELAVRYGSCTISELVANTKA